MPEGRSAGTGSRPTGRRSIDDVLAEVRADLERVEPAEAASMLAGGALVVDIRPAEARAAEGALPGAVILERNVLEWRLDPTSDARLDGVDGDIYDRDVVVVCNEGYASSLAAADLQRLGLRRATDLVGGFRAWAAAGLPVAQASTGAQRDGQVIDQQRSSRLPGDQRPH